MERACTCQKCEKIKEARSRIVDKFAGKEPHEIFEQYVNAELKAMIVEETNRYAALKNSKVLFTTADLETFNVVWMLTGYHSLPRTQSSFLGKRRRYWTVHCIQIYFSKRL